MILTTRSSGRFVNRFFRGVDLLQKQRPKSPQKPKAPIGVMPKQYCSKHKKYTSSCPGCRVCFAAYMKAWRRTATGSASVKKAQDRYWKSQKGRANMKRHDAQPKRKISQRIRRRAERQTPNWKAAHKRYLQSPKGKLKNAKHFARRERELSTEFIINPNGWFEGSRLHHLYPDTAMFIPKELHESIRHNLKTGENMAKINNAAWTWFLTQ